MNPVELTIHRQNTKAFILALPVEYVVRRKQAGKTTAGGLKSTMDILPAQTGRLAQVRGSLGSDAADGVAGTRSAPAKMLVGYHDANLQTNDEVVVGNGTWHVKHVEDDRSYETRAWVELVKQES